MPKYQCRSSTNDMHLEIIRKQSDTWQLISNIIWHNYRAIQMMETKISPNYRDTMRHQSGYNQVKGKESQNILKMRAHNCL